MTNPTTTRAALIPGAVIAIGGAVLAYLAWWFALRTHHGQLIDMMAYEDLATILREEQWPSVGSAIGTMRILTLAGMSVVATLFFAYRRTWQAVAQVVVITVGAMSTAFIMNALAPPMFEAHSTPVHPFSESVHLTTLLLVCAGVAVVYAVPPPARPVTALLTAAIVGALSGAQLTSYGDGPSPHVTASFVVIMWVGLATVAAALVRRAGYRFPAVASRPGSRAATVSALVALTLIAAVAAVAAAILIGQWLDGELPAAGYRAERVLAVLAGALAVGAAACIASVAALVGIHATERLDEPAASPHASPPGPDHELLPHPG